MATTIDIIQPESINDGQDPPTIRNFETVASYNWLDEPKPTILVPGVPPLWDPPVISPVLKPDTGGKYVDQNADRTPGSPLQALIRAVQTCQPGFDFTKVNIVTDRKPIRCLLCFVRAEPVVFRFGVTVVGNTALFTRMEKRTSFQPSTNYHGYRDALEEHYTKISVSAARTTSHHRVVKYDFAGHNILLRYAVDAYLGDRANMLMQADGIVNTDPGPLVRQHKNMDIKGDPLCRTLPSDTPITVLDGGRHIPHAATLELTTRAQGSKAPDSIRHKTPGFWISQTMNYHLCYHRENSDGSDRSTIFNRMRFIPMGEMLKGWEQDNAEKLRALAHVLRQITTAAKELGGSCIVSFDGSEGASLKVTRAEGEEVPLLPEDMRSLFLPIKNEAVDVPIKHEGDATTSSSKSQNGTRKRKYGTEDAPKPTGSPPARTIASKSTFRTAREVAVPVQDGEFDRIPSTEAEDGTRKRKLDAEDAPEMTDSPPARRRALNSDFRTPGQAVTPSKEEEPVDSEMAQ